jgi:hypothetical protein
MTDTLDSMGAWSEDSAEAWLPKSFHDRTSAKTLYMGENGCDWIEIRCRSCWIYPDYESPWEGQTGTATWRECKPNEFPEAIEAWALSWVRTPARRGA